MSSVKVYIENWAAWAPGVETKEQWLEWAKGKVFLQDTADKPSLNFLPAMFRRRLAQLSKTSLQVAFDCLQGQKDVPCVFASRHGEMQQLVKLLTAIINDQDVSPAGFSMSVHNTAVGLFSIADKNKAPSTAIAAGPQTFEEAFVEAAGILNNGDNEKVLLVIADESINEIYRSIITKPAPPLALALLLAKKGEESVRMSLASGGKTISDNYDQCGSAFLKWYLSGAKDKLFLPGKRCSTIFEKNVA